MLCSGRNRNGVIFIQTFDCHFITDDQLIIGVNADFMDIFIPDGGGHMYLHGILFADDAAGDGTFASDITFGKSASGNGAAGLDGCNHTVTARFCAFCQINKVDCRIGVHAACSEEVNGIHHCDFLTLEPVGFHGGVFERTERFDIHSIHGVIEPVSLQLRVCGDGGTVMIVDIVQCFIQVSIHFFIAVNTLGEFRGVCIVIGTDGKQVITVVCLSIQSVFPVEGMIFLTIEEQDFIIGIFFRIEFTFVACGIFDCE